MSACPDCGAATSESVVDFGEFTKPTTGIDHAETCPIGRGITEICADDRVWFEEHPGETERHREPHWAEGAELKLTGNAPDIAGEWAGEVVVKQLAPGVRTRSFDQMFLMVDPAAAKEAGVKTGSYPITPPPSGEGVEPPFNDLPFEVATRVDEILEENSWGEILWEGRKIIVIADTYLEEVSSKIGKSHKEMAAGAWMLERGDGRMVYIWSAPNKGSFGLGKPRKGWGD